MQRTDRGVQDLRRSGWRSCPFPENCLVQGTTQGAPRGHESLARLLSPETPRWRLQTGLEPLGFTPLHTKALTEALESV